MNQLNMNGKRSPLFVDPVDLADDPHAQFAVLRETHSLIEIAEGQYMVLHAEHVLPLLTDPRTQQVEGADYVRLRGIPEGRTAHILRDFFLFSNGDAHRSKRSPFAHAFSNRAMREAQTSIRAVADAIVADLPRGQSFDLVTQMATRIPAEMIAGILGLPREDASYFSSLVYDLARAVDPVYPIAHHDRVENAACGLFEYVRLHLESRQRVSQDDLMSWLVVDWQMTQEMSFECLVHQVLGMIVGGTDTTRAAFGMLVALLLERPDDWAALKADPLLIPGAVSEALRFEPSVGSIPRFTTADVVIDDITLPPGVMLLASTMSAMRDPALYVDPDRFDIHRQHPRLHPVFGAGPHRCIGEMLARLELQEGLAALIDAAPGIKMESAPRMTGFGGIRKISPMLVRIP